jgi:hypothetical protein
VDWSLQSGDMVKYVFSAFWLFLSGLAAYYYDTLGHWFFLVLVAVFAVNVHCEINSH